MRRVLGTILVAGGLLAAGPLVLGVLDVLGGGLAHAQDETACVEPGVPQLPEAAAADEAALKEAKALTLSYLEDAARYRSCMSDAAARLDAMIAKTEEGAYRDGLLRRKAAILAAHDANTAKQAELRSRFSLLVQAYKDAHPN